MTKKETPQRDKNMFKGNCILNHLKQIEKNPPWWTILINGLPHRKERHQE
ncbi:MAG: hypothetical protein PHX25_00740 [Candidatus Pacebacteria bacterium]|nr:hypothetical protein [Candidatus Paceibacterota bacterium]